jgi:hypothetical protein
LSKALNRGLSGSCTTGKNIEVWARNSVLSGDINGNINTYNVDTVGDTTIFIEEICDLQIIGKTNPIRISCLPILKKAVIIGDRLKFEDLEKTTIIQNGLVSVIAN